MYLDKTVSLTPDAKQVICHKATEAPHSGIYNEVLAAGSYLCRRCGLALFRAHSQFSAGCGWPSFDDSITNNVAEVPDSDGMRIEIVCGRCDAHLGHIFRGEQHTAKNQRYCVNALSLDFVLDETVQDTREAIFAGGCFWGVQQASAQIPGVVATEVGYIGGDVDSPFYTQVCQGDTGHYEAVRVLFDVQKIDYAAVLRRFFELHDATEAHGQGADIGHQYKSAIFCYDAEQKKIAHALIAELMATGLGITTQVFDMQTFWPAEAYHQDYYAK